MKQRIDVFPGLSFVILVVASSLLLAFMADAIFDQIEGDKKISIEASCHIKPNKSDKLFVSAIFENHSSTAYPIKTLFLVISDNLEGQKRKPVELRIEPENLAWMSEKGLYLEAGEKRYYRLLLTLPKSRPIQASQITCEHRNNGNGDFDGPEVERDKFEVPSNVDGDAFSPKVP